MNHEPKTAKEKDMRNLAMTREWFEMLDRLETAAERWNVLRAAAAYAFTGEVNENLTPDGMAVFRAIQKEIDHRKRAYGRRSAESAHESAESAQNLRVSKKTNGINGLQWHMTRGKNERKRNVPPATPFKEKERETLFFLQEKKEVSKGGKKTKKSPLSPSLEDVISYNEEQGNPIDAESFYDYYEAVGWTIQGKPIMDWKAVFRFWTRKAKRTKKAVPEDTDGWGF